MDKFRDLLQTTHDSVIRMEVQTKALLTRMDDRDKADKDQRDLFEARCDRCNLRLAAVEGDMKDFKTRHLTTVKLLWLAIGGLFTAASCWLSAKFK
jgi:hypothetical protein